MKKSVAVPVVARAAAIRGRKWPQVRFCACCRCSIIGGKCHFACICPFLVIGSLLPFLRAFVGGVVTWLAFRL